MSRTARKRLSHIHDGLRQMMAASEAAGLYNDELTEADRALIAARLKDRHLAVEVDIDSDELINPAVSQ